MDLNRKFDPTAKSGMAHAIVQSVLSTCKQCNFRTVDTRRNTFTRKGTATFGNICHRRGSGPIIKFAHQDNRHFAFTNHFIPNQNDAENVRSLVRPGYDIAL